MSDPAIQIEELREAGPDGGDLMGYYARGHHPRHEFAEASNKYNGIDSDWDQRFVRAGECRHVWWRTVPMAGEPGFSLFADAEPNSRGAYPVTVWDGLATAQSENQKRVIREHHRGKCNGIAQGVNWALRWLETRDEKLAAAMLEAFRAKRDQLEGDAL